MSTGEGTVAVPRPLVVGEPESRGTVVERYVSLRGGAYAVVPVTEVTLSRNAAVEHVAWQEEAPEALHVATLEARQDRDSRFVFFLERARDMGILVGKFLALALLIQAAVTYYVPANVVEPLLGRRSSLSVLFATLISVPLPLPQVAAPAVIKGLLAAGMTREAGMAMLVGGPVTSIPALSALIGVYDRRALALYLGIGLSSALCAGFLFQVFAG